MADEVELCGKPCSFEECDEPCTGESGHNGLCGCGRRVGVDSDA